VASHSLLVMDGLDCLVSPHFPISPPTTRFYLDTTINRFKSTTPQAPDYTRASRTNEFGLFVQDNWRVTPRLTVNLGLRLRIVRNRPQPI